LWKLKMSSILCNLMRSLTVGAKPSPLITSLQKSLLSPQLNDILRESIRERSMRASRRIRGYPRPLLKGVVRPEPMKYGYNPKKPAEYTIEDIPIGKMAGRHPETGHVVVRTIGGGHFRTTKWVDHLRDGPETPGEYFEEKVYELVDDHLYTAKLALVANGLKKRWIIATEGIQVGDIIRTTRELPRMPVRPRNGDAHVLGALPVGTRVHCIEKFPKTITGMCRSAGASAVILRKVEGRVILQLPSKLQMSLNEKCLAVVGQVANADRMETFYPIGSPNRLRRLGHRPRSGFWHRKDGYCGRKVRPPPPVKVIPLRRPATTSQYVL